MHRRSLCSLLVVASGAAHADEPPPPSPIATYALVVGSNAAGPGQHELKYAEDDARRVGALLVELGGYRADSVDVITRPTPEQVRERLAKLAARVTTDQVAGRQARLFFYYSGHARANAIDLGADALPIAELRQRLLAVPATLTVIVLDACQSGAFSRVKGATPAADFSFNSRQQLAASGVAVLASSSGSELSQESETLRSSYFTHHLLVGLRGAGDANTDGTVSVDEAYRYAYHQTLLATAATAVGGQHVSLEVDLKGHGEVPLSFPRAATRSIELPAALEGHALVFDRRAKAVVAETHKAKGNAVRIAVAPGDYEVIVRHAGRLRRCGASTQGASSSIDLDRCTNEAMVTATVRKGGGFERPTWIEVTGTIGPERRDGFTDTLEAFGYREGCRDSFCFPVASAGVGVTVARRIERRLWVGGAVGYVGSPRWQHDTELNDLRYSWSTTTAMAVGRGVQPFAETGWFARAAVYAQLGAGIAIGRDLFIDQDNMETRHTYFGPAFSLGAGLQLGQPGYYRRIPSFLHPLAFSIGYELTYAFAIENRIAETHASGGHRLTLGLSYSY